MHKLRAGLLALLCLGAAVGCSTQTSPGDIITGPVVLQLSVGTLNDSVGTISGLFGGPGAGTYLNAVATFRNNLGASAFGSPGNASLKGPGGLAFALGGIFSYGQAPGGNGVVGMPPSYNPPSTAGGYATGFIAADGSGAFIGAPPTPGTYAISTVVVVNGQNQQYGASAALPGSPKVLGAESAPTYVSGGATGGGTFTVSVPAGVSETLIAVFDTSPAQVASVVTHGTTASLPAGTLTAGTAYTAFAIGADYPLVEAGPPANVQQKPTITGAGGTSNLTVSGSTAFTQ